MTDVPDLGVQRKRSLTSLLVGGHLAALIIALEAGQRGDNVTAFAIWSLTSAQVSLVALWVGFGTASYAYRWGALAGVIAAWAYVSYSPDKDNTYLVWIPLWQGGMVILLVQASRFLGARLIHCAELSSIKTAQSVEADSPQKSDHARLDLSQLFAIVSSAACVAAATAMSSQPISLYSLWMDLVYQGPVPAMALASAWAVMTEGHWFTRVLLILICSALIGGGQLAVSAWEALDMFDWWIYFYRAGAYALDAAIVCLSLGMFRLLGYRIVGTWSNV